VSTPVYHLLTSKVVSAKYLAAKGEKESAIDYRAARAFNSAVAKSGIVRRVGSDNAERGKRPGAAPTLGVEPRCLHWRIRVKKAKQYWR
jgi:hypothetical protein